MNESTEEDFSNPSAHKDTWFQVVRILKIFFPTPDNAKKDAKIGKWMTILWNSLPPFSDKLKWWKPHFTCWIFVRCREALGLWRCSPRWWWAPTQPEEVSDLDPKESASVVRGHGRQHQIDQNGSNRSKSWLNWSSIPPSSVFYCRVWANLQI